MQPPFVLSFALAQERTPAQEDARGVYPPGLGMICGIYSERIEYEASIPTLSSVEDAYGNGTLLEPLAKPISQGQVSRCLFTFRLTDDFTQNEHKLFLVCLEPVSKIHEAGYFSQRKINHAPWLLWNRTRSEIMDHYYQWKTVDATKQRFGYPSWEQWKALHPNGIWKKRKSRKASRSVIPSTSLGSKRIALPRSSATGVRQTGEKAEPSSANRTIDGGSKKRKRKDTPPKAKHKRVKSYENGPSRPVLPVRKRRLTQTDLQDTDMTPSTKKKAKEGTPNNHDDAFLRIIKELRYNSAKADGLTGIEFAKRYTDIDLKLIPHNDRPKPKSIDRQTKIETLDTKRCGKDHKLSIEPRLFELVQVCLLLTHPLLCEQRRRTKQAKPDEKDRAWGTNQWQLCGLVDANKMGAIGRAMQAKNMFGAHYHPELYATARVHEDMLKLADEEEARKAKGFWPNAERADIRGLIVKRILPAPATIDNVLPSPPRTGPVSSTDSTPRSRKQVLKIKPPNSDHPTNTPTSMEICGASSSRDEFGDDGDFSHYSPLMGDASPLFGRAKISTTPPEHRAVLPRLRADSSESLKRRRSA